MKTAVAALAMLAGLGGAAGAQEQGSASAGETYARAVCAECHAVAPGDAESPLLNAAPFAEIMARPEMTAMAVAAWLQGEHDLMPHMMPKPEEMNDLLAYMASLKR